MSNFCPLCFLSDGWKASKWLLHIIGAIFGATIGFMFYFFALLDMNLHERWTLLLGACTTVLLAVGNSISKYVRCVCLLTLSLACGRIGRQYLKAFAIALVLTGPLTNLGTNGKEVVRVFGCTSQLMFNLTKTKYQLLVKPFQDALLNMKHDQDVIVEALETVEDVVDPLVEEVEGKDEIDKIRAETDYIDLIEGDSPRSREIEKKYAEIRERKRQANANGTISEAELYELEYKRKIEYRCNGIINQGAEKCLGLFQSAYDSCYSAVTAALAWLICWPMKITFLCNLVTVFGGSSLCDASHVIEPGFGQGYSTVKHASDLFSQNLGNVKVIFTLHEPKTNINTSGLLQVAQSATQDFDATKSRLDFIGTSFKRLLTLLFFLLVYRSANYLDKYLTDLDFDNRYITKYFRILNQRQIERGAEWLLPLSPEDEKFFKNPAALLPDRAAACRIIYLTFMLILEVIPVTIFFALDLFFHDILEIIAKEAHVEFTQTGDVNMNITVGGGGLVANLVRSLVRDLNVKHSVNVKHTNLTCLPRPQRISNDVLAKVYGIYLLVWVLILAEAYTARLNRLICAHFYPKREKRRILYLFNETLFRKIRQKELENSQ